MKRRAIPIAAVLAVAIAAVSPHRERAWAHAFPTGEDPKVGSTVASPPQRVVITYDAPIESLFATLEVTDNSGTPETEGAPEVGTDKRMLSVKLKPLKPGDYKVKWGVVAEDGHRIQGSYDFTVAGDGL